MAYASKSEQRLQLNKSYSGGVGTLNSTSYKKVGDMPNNDKRLVGSLMKGPDKVKLYGKTGSAQVTAGVAGKMGPNGFTNGPRWKRAMEPGELKPGTAKQAKNTVRLNFTGGKDKGFPAKNTGSTSKVLKGGKGY
jgi:hypothetical protein